MVIRGEAMRSDSRVSQAGMAAVAGDAQMISTILEGYALENECSIAVYNGPKSHVVSGEFLSCSSSSS